MKYCFETQMTVRDYECDIEGIVNSHSLRCTKKVSMQSLPA